MQFNKITAIMSALLLTTTAIGSSFSGIIAHAADTETFPGDVNADGIVSKDDALMLQQWLVRKNTALINRENADINKDEKVNASDLTRLKRMLSASRSTSDYQGLVINEACSSNDKSFKAEDETTPDWLELYNGSDQAMDISGVGLTNGSKNKYKFVFPEGTILQAHTYVLILCDKTTIITKTEYHADFKLSASGETITLTAPRNADGTDGAVIDTVVIPVLRTDETYGRYENGAGEFSVLSPTPNDSNDTAEKIIHVAEPVFSQVGGFYDEGFNLTLSDTSGSTILYTTDGSDPRTSETAKTYTKAIKIYDNTNDENIFSADTRVDYDEGDADWFPSPKAPDFNVDKGIVVKAVCRDKDENDSPVAVNGYYINKTKSYYQDMKVISLSVDEDDLFGEFGIIAHTYNELEFPCNLQVFDGGQIAYTENVGIKISGNFSTGFPQKSFVLSAKKKFGASKMNYDFFDGSVTDVNGKKIKEYDKIKLRAGGNDQFETMIRDDVNHLLAKDGAFATQGTENCVVFLNGEFWGFYTIREHKNADFIGSHYGIDPEKIVVGAMGSFSNQDSPAHRKAGEDFQEFFQWMQTADMTKPENYQRVCDTIDMESYIQYVAYEEYINNADWSWNNWEMWKSTEIDPDNPYADGKWRFVLFDTDISTGEAFDWGYDSSCYGSRLPLMRKDDISDCGSIYAAVACNPQFAEDFYQAIVSLSETKCSPEVTDALIDAVSSSVEEAVLDSFKRYSYPYDKEYFQSGIERMKEFFHIRKSYARITAMGSLESYGNQFDDYVDFPDAFTEIEEEAFAWAYCPPRIRLPESIRVIGPNAFTQRLNMTDIVILNPNCEIADCEGTIPDSAIIHGYPDSTAQAFAERYGRTFVAIQEGIASGSCNTDVNWTLYADGTLSIDGTGSMPDYAKNTDTPWSKLTEKITSIKIGDAVNYVGENAFSACTKAKTIEFYNPDCAIADNANVIGNATKIIGYKNSAIESYAAKHGKTFTTVIDSGKCGENTKWTVDKSGLLSISGSGEMDNYESATQAPWYDYRYIITSVKMSNTVTSAGTCAFALMNKMESVTLSNTISSIPEAAFAGCQNLKTITIPDGVTYIGVDAFRSSKLETIQLPESLEVIDERAFFLCGMLTEISIPDNVHTVGSGAFSECVHLRNVKLPENLTAITRESFAACPIRELILPDHVKSIEYQAFFGCGMESMVLPESVEFVEDNALWCFDLHEITVLNPNMEIPDVEYALAYAKIKGYKGSTAQKFAEKYGFEFTALTK